MAKRSGAKRDFMQVAREIVEHAIGEQMNGDPLITPQDANLKAVAGRKGGIKGGPARARKLSAAVRKKIAQRAANKRWANGNLEK